MEKYMIWTEELKIRLHETDSRKKLSATNILNYLQEIAVNHSKHAGYGLKTLSKDNKAWVLNRTHVKMYEYPKFNDIVVAETWIKSAFRSLSYRESVLRSKTTGKIICKAVSLWACINTSTLQLTDIGDDLLKKINIRDSHNNFGKIKKLETFHSPSYVTNKIVNHTDIDAQNHVNNTKYFEWAIQALDITTYETGTLDSFTINYEYPAYVNENITLEHYYDTSLSEKRVFFNLYTKKYNNPVCLIELIFTK